MSHLEGKDGETEHRAGPVQDDLALSSYTKFCVFLSLVCIFCENGIFMVVTSI